MKRFISLFMVCIICITCSDNKSSSPDTSITKDEPNTGDTQTAGHNEISFVVNGVSVKTRALGVSTSPVGAMQLINIVSDQKVNAQTINISINGTSPGDYTFSDGITGMQKEGLCFGSYTPNASSDMMNVYSFIDGTVKLLSINSQAKKIEATFSGTVQNAKNERMKITEGNISLH